MCGIVGYIGHREAANILLEGLKKLEYRGYDSSGIGIVDYDGRMALRKAQGKIKNLVALISRNGLPQSHLGISHTRWATHGIPNDTNAPLTPIVPKKSSLSITALSKI